jgi:putative ATP-binding cassette transporter
MMAAAAFTQAQTSLRWFVDNFSQIAEWRATLLRVATFRLALLTPLEQPGAGERIAYEDAPAGTLTIDELVIPDAAGSLRLEPEHVVIRSPERVVVAAAPGVDKTLLFRALDGLRPWGRGRIGRPPDEAVLYMPRGTPYLPTGSLRDALCYPLAPRRFDDRTVRDALERLGLARLVPELDVVRRWDRELGIDEQLALAFARARLHAPAWLVIDGGLGALDAETRALAVDVFEHELAGTAIIHIGAVDGASGRLFERELRLVRATAAPSPVPAADEDRKRGEAS